eukprot:02242_1
MFGCSAASRFRRASSTHLCIRISRALGCSPASTSLRLRSWGCVVGGCGPVRGRKTVRLPRVRHADVLSTLQEAPVPCSMLAWSMIELSSLTCLRSSVGSRLCKQTRRTSPGRRLPAVGCIVQRRHFGSPPRRTLAQS